MHSFAATLTTGTVLFVATNVDDVVILTLFFSQIDRRWLLIVGQYLGFSALIAIIGKMGMPIPHNSLPMMGGPGPFDHIAMGGCLP